MIVIFPNKPNEEMIIFLRYGLYSGYTKSRILNSPLFNDFEPFSLPFMLIFCMPTNFPPKKKNSLHSGKHLYHILHKNLENEQKFNFSDFSMLLPLYSILLFMFLWSCHLIGSVEIKIRFG